MNLEQVLSYIEKVYPLTIVEDRYNGTYSGGVFLAFPLQYRDMPEEPAANDCDCAAFWNSENELEYLIGKGTNPNDAALNLQNRYISQYIQLGGEPEKICDMLGHDLIYNFPSMPTKATCRICGKKFKADYSGDILHDDIWKEIQPETNCK